MENESVLILIGILAIILLMFANLWLLKEKKDPPSALEIGQALTFPTTPEIAQALNIPSTEDLKTALSASLEDKQISSKIGAFTILSTQMTEATAKFNQMVQTKSKRAAWGEWHLEEELKETFPNVQIRSEVKELGNLKPDAHVRTPDGKILIVDSKFVYDTYNKIQDTPASQIETLKKLQTTFVNDVRKHVEKIESDYVQPGKGTHEVAYMYIPSMGVYEYLIEYESATVRWAASKGVVICSPVNLMANMHMLEIVRMAQNMSSMHNEILDAHLRIKKSFDEFEEEYKKLSNHLKNAVSKRDEVTALKEKLSLEITGLSSIDNSIAEDIE